MYRSETAILLILFLIPFELQALLFPSPMRTKRTTISDNRLEHTNSFPDPGYGYSPLLNHVFSKCINSRFVRSPTFDFKVTKKLVSKRYLNKIRTKRNASNKVIMRFLSQVERSDTLSLQRERYTYLIWMLSTKHASGLDKELKLIKKYHSMLDNGKLATFYSLCGTHLIQSVTTFSSYHIALRFDGRNRDDAKNFATSMTQYLRSFNENPSKNLAKELVRRTTSLFIEGIGIASNSVQTQKINLIPDDLVQLKTNISRMDESLSSGNYGKIDSISVGPWYSLPNFLDNLSSEILDTFLENNNRSIHRKNGEQVASLAQELQKNLNFRDISSYCIKDLNNYSFETNDLIEHHLFPGIEERAITPEELRSRLNRDSFQEIDNLIAEQEYTVNQCFETLESQNFHGIEYDKIESCQLNGNEIRDLEKITLSYCPIRLL